MVRRWAGVVLGAGLVGSLLTACDDDVPANGWLVDLVSVNADGTSGGNVASQRAVVSPDGTKVAFVTNASNLGPHDANNGPDVYLRDLVTGRTSLASASADGTNSGNSGSSSPTFSPDGTKLAFTSNATNLGVPDGDLEADVYVRDLTNGSLARVKPGPDPCGSAHSDVPVFSPDGTKLAFVRWWFREDFGQASDVYVHDFTTGTTTLASAHTTGASCVDDAQSTAPAFSRDGRELVFVSTANDLGPHDSTPPSSPLGDEDVYVRDLVSGTTTLVSANAAGTDAVNHVEADQPLFTPDGSHVVFTTSATGLGPADTNGDDDVYIRDLAAGTTALVSVNAAGTSAALGSQPVLSPDGRKVAFSSSGNTFGPVDSDVGLLGNDVYVRDLTTGVTSLVSANVAGTDSANGNQGAPRFVGNGRVAFVGSGSNDVAVDTNGRNDLFVRDLALGVTTLVSTNAAGTDSANGAVVLRETSVSADGSAITFTTPASNQGPADANGLTDVYVARYHEHADLSVTLTATPDPVATGAELSYGIDASSAGPDRARTAGVVVDLPDGVTFLDGTSTGGACIPSPDEPDLILCPLGDLGPGDSAHATIRATVTAPAGSSLTTSAVVGSLTLDKHEADNTAEVHTEVST
jgi:Tol biopolymer transport system component